MRENKKELQKASGFKNRADVFLQTGEHESAAVGLDLLHAVDQDCETGAIDIADICQVHPPGATGFFSSIVSSDLAI